MTEMAERDQYKCMRDHDLSSLRVAFLEDSTDLGHCLEFRAQSTRGVALIDDELADRYGKR